MNIKHLIQSEIEFACNYLVSEHDKIKNSKTSKIDKMIDQLNLPTPYYIILTKLLHDASVGSFTDEAKLELMNALIDNNELALKHFPWIEQ